MKKVLIIGLGRFGTLLAEILKSDFEVFVWSKTKKIAQAKELGVTWIDLKSGISKCEVIFYCVPISEFEKVFLSHKKILAKAGDKLVIDIQSIKVLPKKILQKHLPKNCQAILTHPLFGPASVRENGLAGLRIMMEKFTADKENYLFWKNYFHSKKLQVIEISSKEHDRQAAVSQGVVFFLGKVLADFGFGKTKVDTFWAEQLQQIVHGAVGNDSQQLFIDLQTKNPFTKQMRINLSRSLERISRQLLPKRINQKKIIFGIQGGEGSFNHQAILSHVRSEKIKDYQIKFLFTSERVLSKLSRGDIDFGLFAIQNSVGGLVDESIFAMANHKFKIVKQISIPIQHFLMRRKDVANNDLEKVLTHSQVIRQCAQTLKRDYKWIKIETGKGDLVDHALVAKKLAQGKLNKNIAVIGSEVLAELHDLEIIGRNLQDDQKNLTTFMLVSR